MMRPDVIELRKFYHTHLGQVVRRLLVRKIRKIWPDISNLRLLGLGYATPYMYPFRAEAERTLALMPAEQGIIHWPHDGPGLVGLAEDTELPLPDNSIDRVVWVHGLEFAETTDLVLQEIWRVLTSSGKLLVIVPVRRSIWSRMENTPFGYGHPYSDTQLRRILKSNMFTAGEVHGALYFPPSRLRLNLRAAQLLERIGEKWWAGFSGVRLIEAEKQIFAIPEQVQKKRRRRRPVIAPAARPISAAEAPNRMPCSKQG
ncbi:class I SAM-dependent methyltransferase [Sneathiella chinensis]|uniref:Methyltransferase type 11 n=1 Tax=Sneathiella chinensis TaxID=349750 RepID=A0ABQ5TZK9_9PROT|nr:methyltransferase domain-containing protein [Sneathiella chinensis]GLQ05302.1 methyltransferase type 11 [Sneathiella chinensis]